MKAYIHSVCGKPAFYLENDPKEGDLVRAEDCIYPGGGRPKNGERIICGSCLGFVREGQHLSLDRIKDIEP